MFYDTHAHLDYPDYAADLPQVIERATAAGISKIISIGTDLESSARAIELSERFSSVYAVVGWHPSFVDRAPDDLRSALRKLAGHPKVVALGETGLDFNHLPSEKPECTAQDDERYKCKQKNLFRQHLEIAAELELNCVIHQRDAFDATIAALQPFAARVRGVFHCFVGDVASLHQVLSLGSLVSYTGIVTFKNAKEVRETLAATPLDRFMLETDCPYLAPVPYRGKRCEPAYVREIAATIAQVKNRPLDELSKATCETAQNFFSKFRALNA